MDKRGEWQEKKPVETGDIKLCHKWAVADINAARMCENAHQHILNIIKCPNAMDGMKTSSRIYFAQKIEFEDLYKRGIVKSLWDFYQTKDERMKFWRNLKGKEYNAYMEKIYNEEKKYF